MILAVIPRPSEVIENLDIIKEWLIFAGLILAVAIGVVTLGGMIWKTIQRRVHAKRMNVKELGNGD